MVQVENEYGSFGIDKPYIAEIRDIVKQAGFTGVPYSNVTGIRTLRIMHWMICFGQSTLVQGLILTINLSVCKNSVLIFR